METNTKIIENADLTLLSLDSLQPSPLNTFEVGDVSDLEGNIRVCGLIEPLAVIGPDDAGKYTILSGERRYTAIRNLVEAGNDSLATVPCHVIADDTLSEEEQQLIIEYSNMDTRDFDKTSHRFQIIKVLKKMADRGQFKHQQIVKEAMKYIPLSDRYCRMYLQIFEHGDSTIRDLVENKKMTIAEAANASSLTPEEQKQIAKNINEGQKAREAINEFRKKDDGTGDAFLQEPGKASKEAIAAPDTDFQDFSNLGGDYEEYETPDDYASYAEMPDDYDAMADNLGSFDDYASAVNANLNLDTTGELGKMRNEVLRSDEQRRKDTLKTVVDWCSSIVRKGWDSLSDGEKDAVRACRLVVEHFNAASSEQSVA